MNSRPRLRKMMRSLTSKQQAINHVTRMQRFESFAKFCASPPDHLEIFSPLEELAAQVEDAVVAALPDADDRKLEKAVRAAVQEVTYLVYLHQNVISLVAQEERVLVILAELAARKLTLVILSSIPEPVTGSDGESIARIRWEDFVNTMQFLFLHFYDVTGTVKHVEDEYFDGLSILFKESRDLLEYVDEQLAEVVKMMNMFAPERPSDIRIADLESLRDAARQKSEWRCSNLIDMAKADALSYLGDRSGAKSATLRISERLRAPGDRYPVP